VIFLISRVPKKTPGVRRQIVHLGNVGDDRAYRSKMLVQRFSDFDFHGIDLKGLRSKQILHRSLKEDLSLTTIRENRLKQKKPRNLKQTKAEFIKGLSRFPDNSLDIVTSDFAVGFYKKEGTYKKTKENSVAADKITNQYANIGSEAYTKEVIDLIYKKLKPKGKLIIYYFLDKSGRNRYFKYNVGEALKHSNFLYYKTEAVDISKIPQEYRSIYTLHLTDSAIYRVIAEKE
jgi:hypothetical protein